MEDEEPNKDVEHRHAEAAQKNARVGLIVLAVVVGMAGLSFAAVPLYDAFCRVTGFGGTTGTDDALPGEVLERSVKVQFNADISSNMTWEFAPEERFIEVKLGQKGLTAYRAKNTTNRVTKGSALYNVTPLKAGKYFKKIQCFCFDEQSLKPYEEVSMPVFFYVDPAMNDDPNMEDVHTITLSYTFYPADEYGAALEAQGED
ncbi:MAG: cytochrome c oxidase assembly protein [Micavibrio sp.]|nr:cytochrome c oxidase assembly protein [Micavibrio sp.]